ncbi:MAG TPA: thiaminase II [Alphaproteobacteria bacterium]|jgi:thiaminase/transcriptional activator TenA|nr:thiaminase II [Alphaproteobacteria bacterium]HJM49562.1 thiaminase II [Alphaproteobacteria bacterium]|tara:strand:+ start:342 stop:1001 length:660 start_codon:yes stop_codon:yes gene_type:complete
MAEKLFDRLRAACAEDWRAYVEHEFVRQLGDGSLPDACFRHYLCQDYLFLIHFARAYALAAYKSQELDDIRQAAAGLAAITDLEMGLHVEFCAGWGLDEAAMQALPEAEETMAYTRYVLEKGLSGDLLDLHVALAPCVIGYGEIGRNLAGKTVGNPYAKWIEMYASDDYQEVAAGAADQLDSLYERRAGEGRWPEMVKTFGQATRLEVAFWEMGLKMGG